MNTSNGSELPVVDDEIVKQTRGLADGLRNAMVFCRQMRDGSQPVEIKLVEDYLFLQTVELAALTEKVEARLEAYREVVTAANTAILDVDADDRDMAALLSLMQRCTGHMERKLRNRIIDPAPDAMPVAPMPGNVIVFTGSYRPQPANDAAAPGGAA